MRALAVPGDEARVRDALSGGTTRAILLVAFLSSIVSFATLVWLMPAANQEFRQQVFAAMGNRGTVMKGFSEMSVRELEAEIASAKSLGSERGARRVAWHYHLKLSLAFASLLAMFALATVGRGSLLSRALILLSPVGYWLLLWLGQWQPCRRERRHTLVHERHPAQLFPTHCAPGWGRQGGVAQQRLRRSRRADSESRRTGCADRHLERNVGPDSGA